MGTMDRECAAPDPRAPDYRKDEITETVERTVESLNLPWGYRAEHDGTAMRLVDPLGRRVTQFSDSMSPGDLREASPPDRINGASISVEGWKGLCRLLLIKLFEQARDQARLREQMLEMGERLERVEEERNQANAVAEDLYKHFREHAREVSENNPDGEVPVDQANHRGDPDKKMQKE